MVRRILSNRQRRIGRRRRVVVLNRHRDRINGRLNSSTGPVLRTGRHRQIELARVIRRWRDRQTTELGWRQRPAAITIILTGRQRRATRNAADRVRQAAGFGTITVSCCTTDAQRRSHVSSWPARSQTALTVGVSVTGVTVISTV